ncbi:MAG: sulfite reductase, beta subunit [Erythrobacter sp.]|nr:sulfite reductase, beta subunit [Erythrobacter sp.]
MVFRHIVLFRIHDHVSDAYVDAVIDTLESFVLFPGVVSWRTTRSLDERKGRVVVEDATFESREAFERFRTDPAHASAAKTMAEIADWWVGDYEE